MKVNNQLISVFKPAAANRGLSEEAVTIDESVPFLRFTSWLLFQLQLCS